MSTQMLKPLAMSMGYNRRRRVGPPHPRSATLLALILGLVAPAIAIAQAPGSLKEIETAAKEAAAKEAAAKAHPDKTPAAEEAKPDPAKPKFSAEEIEAAKNREIAINKATRADREAAIKKIKEEAEATLKKIAAEKIAFESNSYTKDRQVGELFNRVRMGSDYATYLSSQSDKYRLYDIAKRRVEAVRDARVKREYILFCQKNMDAWTPILGESARNEWNNAMYNANRDFKEISEKAREYLRVEQKQTARVRDTMATLHKKYKARTNASSAARGSEDAFDYRGLPLDGTGRLYRSEP